MTQAKTLPLTEACSLHGQSINNAMSWLRATSPSKSKEVMDAFEYGFDRGFLDCLVLLEKHGYIIRGGSQPANKDKTKRRAQRQLEAAYRNQ
jgi:hypothetical protein